MKTLLKIQSSRLAALPHYLPESNTLTSRRAQEIALSFAGLAFATEEVRYVRRELKSDPSLEPEEGRPGSANRLALALRRLLACPDLNCDSLDPLTHEAITYARGSL